MIKTSKKYGYAEKQHIVRQVLSGKESVASVSVRYQIGGSMTVYRWIAQFNDGTLASSMIRMAQKSTKTKPPSNPSVPDDLTSGREDGHIMSEKEPDAASQHGQSALIEHLRLKVLALETMIEVAEGELGINIRKKSFAKRSTDSARTGQK